MSPGLSSWRTRLSSCCEIVYGIRRKKIRFIPHGAPNAPFHAEKAAKRKFGLEGRRVLSTFGLISPNKGIEDAIAAMPAIVEKEPTATIWCWGRPIRSSSARKASGIAKSCETSATSLGWRTTSSSWTSI